ncbi:glycosyltransferase family A protein [Stenotrophomonas sp. TWI809]|uniref:glycosyltransferase n=1 Tax=Stenotrophomonas sp. TWI809 TaxID=3136796 RepID=UPI00320A0141
MDVTVVIPTYNDGKRVSMCVDALRKQSYQGSFEVIVVDNGSSRDVAKFAQDDPIARVVSEPEAGSYSARNAGIRQARGRIIAFTDSDCLPGPNWLKAAVDMIDGGSADLVAGRVEIFFKDPARPTSVELYEHRFSFRQHESVPQGWAVTANLVVKASVFDAIGPFNAKTFSGGDAEFTRRAVNAGFKLQYGHEASLAHPARRTLAEISQMRRRHVGGFYRLSKTDASYSSMFSAKGILKDIAYPAKAAALLAKDVAEGTQTLWRSIRVLLVVSHTRWYRAALKIGYATGLKRSYER